MGFQGVIVTDALIMGGIAKVAPPSELAVMAVEAGADILLMPPDPETAIEAIYGAVRSGRLGEERVRESIARVRKAKQKLGRPRDPLETLPTLGEPLALETVKAIVKDSRVAGGGHLPSERDGRNLILVDDLLNCDFLDPTSPAVTFPRQMGYELQLADRTTWKNCLDDRRATLLQVFLRGNPFRGSAGLTSESREVYRTLLETGRVGGAIVYGSPYVFHWFRERLGEDRPFVFTYSQESIAQEMACEALFGLSFPLSQPAREFV
jgi:beta-glucosidase